MPPPALFSTPVVASAPPAGADADAPIDVGAPMDPRPGHRGWRLRALTVSEAGMTTAEYAVGTVAACGFGAVLYKTVTSDVVSGLVAGVIRRALTLSF
jgi:hypothetical protein